MEEHYILKEKAVKHMKIADHILHMTYPLVQDPKLLKLVMKNLNLSINNAISALLYYKNKSYYDDFDTKIIALKKILIRNNISREYLSFLKEFNSMQKNQEKSDVEFIRKEKFVFSGNDYKLNVITKKEMKEYIIKGKLFLNDILGVII